MIEFQESGDLEALEIDFDDLKVPKLGEKAFIDCGSEVDSQGFIKQYKLMRKKENESKKKEEQIKIE